MSKTRYKVQCNVHLYSDQIDTFKKLKHKTEVTRNDVLRVAIDDILKRNPTISDLAKYVRSKADGAGNN